MASRGFYRSPTRDQVFKRLAAELLRGYHRRSKMRVLPNLVLACALALPLGACKNTNQKANSPLQYTENARRDYEQALNVYFDRDWEEAVTLMQEVKRKYGYSRYARLAELRIADADYRQGKFPEAITGYKGFIHDYPNDPEVPYARYKVARALYEQSSQSLLMPPLEERDLAAVNDAYATIREFLSDYPNYKLHRELEYMLEVVTGMLARHELYVARFYLKKDNYPAAVARCQHALRNFEHSGLEAEAMVLLGETYLRMKERNKARAVFQHVLAEYPESPFSLPARRFLQSIGEPGTGKIDTRRN